MTDRDERATYREYWEAYDQRIDKMLRKDVAIVASRASRASARGPILPVCLCGCLGHCRLHFVNAVGDQQRRPAMSVNALRAERAAQATRSTQSVRRNPIVRALGNVVDLALWVLAIFR